ncbi:TIGR01244 family sulfur transferase [Paracoccus sp. (in: a-proteobacteria)]|uniref:TIGR01244 family sulfur transferase n=1 Tax=Paracoccus sp. TaxID=267 RepID=UPI002896D66B|nr:TIGR01244 family sulfur transferase [Paracoccus sp. (in: a-proteobacteria)]
MDLRQLTPDLAVTPQILPEDLSDLAAAGFRVVINNRPDAEVGPDLDSEAMGRAAAEAGMAYHYIPFSPGEITAQMISAYADALSEPGPKVAYCRSGNRSTVLWALTQAGRLPEAEILETAANAGYDLSGVRGLIASLAS